MNRLSIQQRVQGINALVEGNTIRATCRTTGTDHQSSVSEIAALLEEREKLAASN